MKRLALLAAIALAGLTAAGLSAQGQPPVADIEQVSDRVWKIYGQGGNTTVFLRADGVALVDTKLANNGAAILAQVRKVTDRPVTLIVNTHSHGDHVGSNSEIARDGVEVVATGCTSAASPCVPGATGRAEGQAVARVILKLRPALLSLPVAALTTGGWASVCGPFGLRNHDPATQGLLVHAGGRIDLGVNASAGPNSSSS